jgi:hypothetical protein
MRFLRRAALGIALLLLASCSSKADDKGALATPSDLSDVYYGGGATDEALKHLLDAKVKDEPSQYVIVDAPDLDSPVPRDSPATLEFHLASQALHEPMRRSKPAPQAPPAWQRPLRELLQLLGPPRLAYAHGAPYNGTAYLLVVRDADAKLQLRAFTGKGSYTPEADAWQRLVDAPQPLTLEITSAFFEGNDIPADGGPFAGGTFEFQID